MATYTWTLQGTTPTVISATDIIQFAGSAFGTAVFVGNYQDSMHVKTSGGSEKSLGNSPKNTKYIDATHYSLNGGADTLLSASDPAQADCPLKINFAHPSSVAITDHVIYAYNGLSVLAAPTGVTFKIAEQGDTVWSDGGGAGLAMSVADRSAATSHDFYFLVSASPQSIGSKTAFVIRDELIYS